MNDRATMQNVDVIFALEDQFQNRETRSRFSTSRLPSPMPSSSQVAPNANPRAIIFIGSRVKSGINIAALHVTTSNPTRKEPSGSSKLS